METNKIIAVAGVVTVVLLVAITIIILVTKPKITVSSFWF